MFGQLVLISIEGKHTHTKTTEEKKLLTNSNLEIYYFSKMMAHDHTHREHIWRTHVNLFICCQHINVIQNTAKKTTNNNKKAEAEEKPKPRNY